MGGRAWGRVVNLGKDEEELAQKVARVLNINIKSLIVSAVKVALELAAKMIAGEPQVDIVAVCDLEGMEYTLRRVEAAGLTMNAIYAHPITLNAIYAAKAGTLFGADGAPVMRPVDEVVVELQRDLGFFWAANAALPAGLVFFIREPWTLGMDGLKIPKGEED